MSSLFSVFKHFLLYQHVVGIIQANINISRAFHFISYLSNTKQVYN